MRLLIGKGLRGRVEPACAGPALQKWEAVRVEQAAAVGRQAQVLVLHAAVHGPEGGQQPAPGVVAPLQHLLAGLVGHLVVLGHQRAGRIVLVVQRIAKQQQARSSADSSTTSRIMTVSAASYSSPSVPASRAPPRSWSAKSMACTRISTARRTW